MTHMTTATLSMATAIGDATVPMKVTMSYLAAGPRSSDTTSGGSGAGASDTDEDTAPQRLPSQLPPRGLAPPGPPPGLDAPTPPGLGRTPLRSRAAAFIPLPKALPPQPGTIGNEVSSKKKQAKAKETSIAEHERTTIMICHVPFSYNCDALIDLLETKGYSGKFDFVYVPINFTAMLGVGYAFVNLTSHEQAQKFMFDFSGFDGWASSFSKKPCAVRWSDCQGVDENIARYQNSPIMGPDVPAFYKPVLLKDGARVPFPEPTKKLRPLKSRRSRNQHPQEKFEVAG